MTCPLHAGVRQVCLWAAVLAAAIATSGCGIAYQVTLKATEASTLNYQRKTVEYRRQAADADREWNGVLAQERSLEARIAAHAKAAKEEKQLAEQNAALQRRIAETEQEIGRREAATAAAAHARRESSAFAELGKRITDEAYAAAVREARAYEELEAKYAGQLKALSSHPKDSPARGRDIEMIRSQAVLDIIAEAVVAASLPRVVLAESAFGDNPASQQAFASLAASEGELLAALQDFTTHGGSQPDGRRYAQAQYRLAGMRAALTGATAALVVRPDAGHRRVRALAARLDTLSKITDVAGTVAARMNTLMNSPASGTGLPPLGPTAQDAVPLPQHLLQLTAVADDTAGESAQPPARRAAPSLARMQRIAAMAAYSQGAAFDPETYLRMRLEKLRLLKGAVGQVMESYRRTHSSY